jgi:hypothetical protein
MKLKLLLFGALVCLGLQGMSQTASKVFDEVKNVTIRNSGVIKKNNVVKGYYNFYEFDKIDRKTRVFKLNLMDENLNPIGTKEIEGPKEWELISSGFDGSNFCFKFWNEKAKTFELKVYDQQANEVNSETTTINYKPTSMKATSYKQMVNPELNIIPDNGFVDYVFNEPNDAFIINYVGGTSQKSWTQTYEPEGKSRIMLPNFLNGNSDFILTGVAKIEKGFYTVKTQNLLVANSTKDGHQLFEMPMEFDDENHVVPVSAVFENDKIIVIGLNYKQAKTFTTPPDGFAFLEIDKTGKLLKSNFKTFDESLGNFLTIDNGKIDGGYYLYIHNIVKTNKNTNLVIAEKFKKPGGSGALSALAAVSGTSLVALQLENMVVMEYDNNGNVIQAEEVPKAKGTTGNFPSYTGLLSPYFLAAWAKMMGQMDYAYTLKSDDNSEITFSFTDYAKLDADAEKTQNFGQIKYKAGKISVDKIAIKKDKATFSYLLPAKANHIIQVSYFKKEKKMTMEMIKLN